MRKKPTVVVEVRAEGTRVPYATEDVDVILLHYAVDDIPTDEQELRRVNGFFCVPCVVSVPAAAEQVARVEEEIHAQPKADPTLTLPRLMHRILEDDIYTWKTDRSRTWRQQNDSFIRLVSRECDVHGIEHQIKNLFRLAWQKTESGIDRCRFEPPPGLDEKRLLALDMEIEVDYCWICHDGRHFDGSAPDGVEDPYQLAGLRIKMADYLRRMHPVLLGDLCEEYDWWQESLEMCPPLPRSA